MRQYFELKGAKDQVNAARIELHRQRVLQVILSLTSAVSHLTYSIDSGRRVEIRQECTTIAGDISHLRTYGGNLFEDGELEKLDTVAKDVHNVLQVTSKSEEQLLSQGEKAAMRNFCTAAVINMRSYQGRFEKTQDLQGDTDGRNVKDQR